MIAVVVGRCRRSVLRNGRTAAVDENIVCFFFLLFKKENQYGAFRTNNEEKIYTHPGYTRAKEILGYYEEWKEEREKCRS